MKKIIVLLFLFIFNLNSVKASFVVMDQDSGNVLSGSGIHEKKLIASTTKIMTAYVVIKNSNLDDHVIVDDEIFKTHGSMVYLEKGEELTVRDLLYAVLLRSGNDASIVLSKYVGKDTSNFVRLMNEEARKIGMKDTYFENPTGLDDEGTKNISTAYDMALLTKYCMKNKVFRKVFSTKKYALKTNKKSYIWHNKNKTLYMSKYVTGGKTGYTKKAHRTLVSTASKDNMNLIIVTLDFKDDFKFHINKYNYFFDNYKRYLLVNKNNLNINEKYYKNKYRYNFYINKNLYILSKRIDLKNYSIKYIIYKKSNVQDNDLIGELRLYYKDKVLFNEPIYINIY